MATSLAALIRDLKKFENGKELTKQLRARLRKPIPGVRKAIKRRAIDTLPRGGGLNRWVAALRISAVITTRGRGAGVKLKGSRTSTRDKSDLRAIDRGRVRHPAWGRRGPGNWSNQSVPAGFFSDPAAETDAWRVAAREAVEEAAEVIGRG